MPNSIFSVRPAKPDLTTPLSEASTIGRIIGQNSPNFARLLAEDAQSLVEQRAREYDAAEKKYQKYLAEQAGLVSYAKETTPGVRSSNPAANLASGAADAANGSYDSIYGTGSPYGDEQPGRLNVYAPSDPTGRGRAGYDPSYKGRMTVNTLFDDRAALGLTDRDIIRAQQADASAMAKIPRLTPQQPARTSDSEWREAVRKVQMAGDREAEAYIRSIAPKSAGLDPWSTTQTTPTTVRPGQFTNTFGPGASLANDLSRSEGMLERWRREYEENVMGKFSDAEQKTLLTQAREALERGDVPLANRLATEAYTAAQRPKPAAAPTSRTRQAAESMVSPSVDGLSAPTAAPAPGRWNVTAGLGEPKTRDEQEYRRIAEDAYAKGDYQTAAQAMTDALAARARAESKPVDVAAEEAAARARDARIRQRVNEAEQRAQGVPDRISGQVDGLQVGERIPSTVTSVESQPKPAAGWKATWGDALAPNQFLAATQGQLTLDEAMSACGPGAAIAFARATGRNPSWKEAVALAKQVGWTVDGGMAGPESQVNLLKKMGINATMKNANINEINQAVDAGAPVIMDTWGSKLGDQVNVKAGHYFVIYGRDAKGRYLVGGSGLALRGGSEWMTMQEITRLTGPMRAAIYINPADLARAAA